MAPTPGFSQNQTLFGWGEEEGIIALELEGDEAIRVYRRRSGKLESELQEFRPFLWLENPDLLQDFKGNFRAGGS